MHNTHILFLLLGLTIGGLYVQAENAKPITEQCLLCMCEALSGCNATAVCVNGACGIFRITWDQWVDSGRLTIQGDSPLTDTCKNGDCILNYLIFTLQYLQLSPTVPMILIVQLIPCRVIW